MKPFTTHRGRIATLPRVNVDTDQIVPKQFLKRIERTGFGQFLFFDWRFRADGSPDPAFELNQPRAQGASILVAGTNFGCGSSREHAAWALQDYGFDVVVAPSFGDIFTGNAAQIGLLTVALPEEQVRELAGASELTVDLESLTIAAEDRTIPFEYDTFRRHKLLNGLDDVALTLEHEAEIARFQSAHVSRLDTTALPA